MPKKTFVLFRMPPSIKRLQGVYTEHSKVNPADFVGVQMGLIEGDTDLDMCDKLFHAFNLFEDQDIIRGFVGDSMSSGDVIRLFNQETKQSNYYLCCAWGWHELKGWMN